MALLLLMLSSCGSLEHVDLHGSVAGPHSDLDPNFTGSAVWQRWMSCQGTLRGDALSPAVMKPSAALQGCLISTLQRQPINLFRSARWQAVAASGAGCNASGLRAVLRLGRTTSPRVFHGAVGLPRFELAMAELSELDVSEPLKTDPQVISSCPPNLPNDDSPSLLAALLKAAPSLRRLSAHGWGKGYPGESTASALAQALASHPASLHQLSVRSRGPAALRSSSSCLLTELIVSHTHPSISRSHLCDTPPCAHHVEACMRAVLAWLEQRQPCGKPPWWHVRRGADPPGGLELQQCGAAPGLERQQLPHRPDDSPGRPNRRP